MIPCQQRLATRLNSVSEQHALERFAALLLYSSLTHTNSSRIIHLLRKAAFEASVGSSTHRCSWQWFWLSEPRAPTTCSAMVRSFCQTLVKRPCRRHLSMLHGSERLFVGLGSLPVAAAGSYYLFDGTLSLSVVVRPHYRYRSHILHASDAFHPGSSAHRLRAHLLGVHYINSFAVSEALFHAVLQLCQPVIQPVASLFVTSRTPFFRCTFSATASQTEGAR